MEINDGNVQALCHYLGQTLQPEPEARREAEAFLKSVEGTPGFAPLLMHTMGLDIDPAVRQACAICFKNLIKRHWVIEDEEPKINAEDREAIKEKIVDLMLILPESEQKQVSEAIAIIGRSDFPAQWPSLLPSMLEKFALGDFHIINGVLRTAHSLFRRYRYEYACDELFTEILEVLGQFAKPLTELFKTTIDLLAQYAGDTATLSVLYNSILLMCKVYRSLTSQDLADVWAEPANLNAWLERLHMLLVTPDNPALASADSDQLDVLGMIKAEVCNIVVLFADKYDDDCADIMLSAFFPAIMDMLVHTPPEPKSEQLISTAINVLTLAAERPRYKDIFANQEILQQTCEQIVVPNMTFGPSDEEMFEFDPEQYTRRDIEGADVDTRRRSASNLVRGLCTHWREQVTGIFSAYITTLLQDYAANPKDNWRSKDVAIYLITSLAVTSKVQALGATQVNEFIDINDVFNTQILPDLQSPEQPVLTADALKYVLTFRNQIPKSAHIEVILPLLVNHLGSQSIVVSTYAAACLEKQLMLKDGDVPFFNHENISPYLEHFLGALFNALATDENTENEYIMKAIMRIIVVGKSSLLPYVATIVDNLSKILEAVAQNPRKPKFNHYMFEAFGSAIRYTCETNPAYVESFEGALFPSFEMLLQKDVVEFQPYVFQLMAQLLELRDPPLAGPYREMFGFLLSPPLWENRANTTPLVRLICACIAKGADTLLADSSALEGILNTFRKLIFNRTLDIEGFNLVNALVEYLPLERLQPYINAIVGYLLQRTQKAKTTQFLGGFLKFVALFVAKYGGDLLIQTLDGMQPGLFGMLMNRFVSDVTVVKDAMDRKTCLVGLARLLTESSLMMSKEQELWAPIASLFARLAGIQGDVGADKKDMGGGGNDEESILANLENQGYQSSFAKLAFAGRPKHDPFGEVHDAHAFFGQQVFAAASQAPGQLSALIPHDMRPFVDHCMQAAGIAQPLP